MKNFTANTDTVRLLVEEFMPLARDEARRSREARRHSGDFEVLSAATWGLLEAARSFVPARQSADGFAPHARFYIRARIRSLRLRVSTRRWLCVSAVSEEPAILESIPAPPEDNGPIDDVREALCLLDDSDSSLLRRHYGIDCDQVSTPEMAVADGVTERRLRLRLKNAHERMKNAILSLRG